MNYWVKDRVLAEPTDGRTFWPFNIIIDNRFVNYFKINMIHYNSSPERKTLPTQLARRVIMCQLSSARKNVPTRLGADERANSAENVRTRQLDAHRLKIVELTILNY